MVAHENFPNLSLPPTVVLESTRNASGSLALICLAIPDPIVQKQFALQRLKGRF
jgi:hypothetical protein